MKSSLPMTTFASSRAVEGESFRHLPAELSRPRVAAPSTPGWSRPLNGIQGNTSEPTVINRPRGTGG